MPVVDWVVRPGYRVEARDGALGTVAELFNGPPRSMFLSQERYMRVTAPDQPDLFIPFVEIVDVGELEGVVYLKRWLREINALSWTRDPRVPLAGPPIPYRPQPQVAAARPVPVGRGRGVPPRERVASGVWQPGAVAPRPEPGKAIRIGDRFSPGDVIPAEGQYMCTVCWTRKHSQQFREENPDGRFPPPHHPGGLWELEDLRP